MSGTATIVLRDDGSGKLLVAALALAAALVSFGVWSVPSMNVARPWTHAELPTERLLATQVPLTFTESPDDGYVAFGSGSRFRFRDGGVSIGLPNGRGATLALTFIGGETVRPEAEVKLPGTINRFVGRDAAAWQVGLTTYEEIAYRDVWPGVDIVFRGDAGSLKYDVVLKPGASLSDVRLRYEGASGLRVESDGDLIADVTGGHVIDSAPFGTQRMDGATARVATRFALSPGAPDEFGFSTPDGFDPTRTLVIDPGIVYRTSLGGADFDQTAAVAVGPDGSLYIAGRGAAAWGTPTTPGAYDETYNGHIDLFVAKLDATGTLIYSTFIGGEDDGEHVNDLALGADGSVYVAGFGFSTGYPTTPGAWNDDYMSFDGYGLLTKLGPTGSSLDLLDEAPRNE